MLSVDDYMVLSRESLAWRAEVGIRQQTIVLRRTNLEAMRGTYVSVALEQAQSNVKLMANY